MMNLAKMSTNGQITVPVEIRRMLNIKAEDKIVFMQNDQGEIIVQKLNIAAIKKTQYIDATTVS